MRLPGQVFWQNMDPNSPAIWQQGISIGLRDAALPSSLMRRQHRQRADEAHQNWSLLLA
jgi:hypothetical protein